MATEIKVIKFQSGEEIVGIVEIPLLDNENSEDENSDIDLSNILFVRGAMKIVYAKNEHGTNMVYLYDWILSTDDDLYPIQKHQILTIVNASERVENLYCEVALNQYALDSGSLPDDSIAEMEEKALKKMLDDIEFDDEDLQ